MLQLADITLVVNLLRDLLGHPDSSFRQLIENYLRFQLDQTMGRYRAFDSPEEFKNYRSKIYEFIYQ